MSVRSLAYLGFEVSDLNAWDTFCTEVLALMPAARADGDHRYRMDLRAWRIALNEGPKDDLSFLGFEVNGPDEFEAIKARMGGAGIVFSQGSAELIADRGVMDMVTCQDPEGLDIEVVWGASVRPETLFRPSANLANGFVTGNQGLGHVFLKAMKMDETRKFYKEGLGFELSDIIHVKRGADIDIDLEFYHCNTRHHTLALAPLPIPKRIGHFMVQGTCMDDVGFAMERFDEGKHPIASPLGRHSNDHMTSVYAKTPSGFEVEFGFGARTIDPDNWEVERYDRIAAWGHKR